MIKVSDYIFKYIANLGIKHVFMLAGGAAMHMVDSLGRNKELQYVCSLHEQCAAVGADAYAQITGNLGVSLVTSGPGGTNTVTGVAGSWLDSTPVLVISGQVRTKHLSMGRCRQLGFQELPITGIVKTITKYSKTVLDARVIRYALDQAVYYARNGRPGPVWLDIPLDIQEAKVDEDTLRGFTPLPDNPPDLREDVQRVMGLLSLAKKPVLLLGHGVRHSMTHYSLMRFIERLGIPVLLTWRAADLLPEDHPLFVGRPGLSGQPGSNMIQREADFMLTIGARLDYGQTAYRPDTFAPKARKIMVDIDPAEIRKMNPFLEMGICCNAANFVQHFHPHLPLYDYSDWVARCKTTYQANRISYPWVDQISEMLTGEEVLVLSSAGAASERVLQAIKVKEGTRIINSPGLGAMGFAIPASIGAALASGKKVICVDGDGSFAVNYQELEVVRRLTLPIEFYVIINNGYGSIKATQDKYFDGHYVGCNPESGLTLPLIYHPTLHPRFIDFNEETIRDATD